MSDPENSDEAPDDPRMETIAKAVSDGAAVDWDGVGQENPEARPLIDGLRFVETVAAAHRRLLESESPSGDEVPPAPPLQ